MAWGNSVFNQNPAYSLYYMHAKQDIVTQRFRKEREKKTSMRKYLYKAFDCKNAA